MIEKILRDFLVDYLSAPVYTEIPKSYPSRFYTIEKTGSARDNHINSSTVALKSYSSVSLYDAAEMNEELKEVMLYNLIESPEIIRVELNSDYNFTDSATKQYRYQAVFDIKHY